MRVVSAGGKWVIRRRWLPWRPAISQWCLRVLGGIMDAVPSGPATGNDPISAILGLLELLLLIPGLMLIAVVGAEFAVQVVLVPFTTLVRAVKVTGWPVDLYRDRKFAGTAVAPGFSGTAKLRAELAEHLRRGGLPTDPTASALVREMRAHYKPAA